MNEDKKVFDKEFVAKPIIFLKGIGRRCPICNRHIFGRADKKTCSDKCRRRQVYLNHNKQEKNNVIKAQISILKKHGRKEYRILSLYLKKGIVHQIQITSEYKELWSLLEKIEQFRDISKPLMEITA